MKQVGAIAAVAVIAVGGWYFYNQDNSIVEDVAAKVDAVMGTDFDKPGSFAEHILGNPDAKVTIVEYASLTCPHCANFHVNTFKQFKKEYVDTGKVKFVYRDFYLDDLARGTAMLAQCAPEDQYFSIIDLVFTNQRKWMSAEKPFAAIGKLLKLTGYSDEKINTCLADASIGEGVIKDRQRGADFGVNSTPTIFVNGVKQAGGNLSYAGLTKTVDALLAE